MAVVVVVFAKAFRRHVVCPDEMLDAADVRGVLVAYFAKHPVVQSYVVDEQFSVRRHVALFVNDNQVVDRIGLSDPLSDTDTVHVFQALSGGCG